jgi:cytidylate kinase
MPRSLFIASIEARIDTWQRILESKKKEAAQKKRGITITISREFGCEGFPLAEKLKTLLEEQTGEEWVIFDRALIEKIARDIDISPAEIKHIEDRFSFLDIFSSFRSKSYTKGQVFHKVAEYILKVAKVGNAIIVGRGGAFITKDLENCFHFRLVAPFEFRVSSIAKRLEIEESAAEKFVIENSHKREQFLNDFFSKDINDPSYFHAVFNNEKLNLETITDCIFKCLSKSLKK